MLKGAPRGMRIAFRKWEENGRMGNPEEREVLVPLSAALEAIRS